MTKGSKFVYLNDGIEKIILDLDDFMMNKSRIPFHSIKGDRTVSDIVIDLMDAHDRISEGTDEHRYLIQYTLLDTLILRSAVQTSKPLKALELGAVNGVLSYHLGTILGILNKDSEMVCVCDTIGNGSENRWIDAICQIKEREQPQVRFLASDYDSTMLKENAFDIVIINATNEIKDIKGTVVEAMRAVKSFGEVFCICHDDNWLLYDMFMYFMAYCDDYQVGEKGFIIHKHEFIGANGP